MIATLSLSSLIAGGSLSYASMRNATRAAAYETWGGALLIIGLSLAGAGLTLFR
ncbi:hypothetical protein [Methylobacterium marchantiae]|uniref:Uncharacterized protein n=1 Tax=Methylobacterium marchantiae TaxID=600331 RepID=A0ABW3X085_9HYPH|nr:hypothetical protein AIGOOFII_1731 [Methylobacterium marchantiae]